ncbi:MAG: helix-turn-helix domain-containing protein [Phycisphaeraceae bacterium]
MHNFATIAPGRSRTIGLELFRLWDVDEDAAYQIDRIWEHWDGASSDMPTTGRTGLVAVRTLGGVGWIGTADGRRQTVATGSVMAVPWLSLTGWGTESRSWRFYWFEFYADDIEPLLMLDAAEVPAGSTELGDIGQIQSKLRSPLHATRALASARFAALLYHWLEQAAAEPAAHRHHAEIERAIALMQSSTDRQLTINDMANAAGLSPRSFASAFEQATQQTPKRYHLNLRLDAARNLLLSGRANVKQTASQLGFSSPFYLSKLYRKRFGHPPSQAH